MLILIVSFYPSFKRAFPVYIMELREIHMYLALIGFLVVIVHVLNKLHKIKFSVSFVLLFMTFAIVASGLVGKYIASRSEMAMKTWRSIHRPYTILYYIVLIIHTSQKLKIL